MDSSHAYARTIWTSHCSSSGRRSQQHRDHRELHVNGVSIRRPTFPKALLRNRRHRFVQPHLGGSSRTSQSSQHRHHFLETLKMHHKPKEGHRILATSQAHQEPIQEVMERHRRWGQQALAPMPQQPPSAPDNSTTRERSPPPTPSEQPAKAKPKAPTLPLSTKPKAPTLPDSTNPDDNICTNPPLPKAAPPSQSPPAKRSSNDANLQTNMTSSNKQPPVFVFAEKGPPICPPDAAAGTRNT